MTGRNPQEIPDSIIVNSNVEAAADSFTNTIPADYYALVSVNLADGAYFSLNGKIALISNFLDVDSDTTWNAIASSPLTHTSNRLNTAEGGAGGGAAFTSETAHSVAKARVRSSIVQTFKVPTGTVLFCNSGVTGSARYVIELYKMPGR